MKRYDSSQKCRSKFLSVVIPVLLCFFFVCINIHAEDNTFQRGGEGAVTLDAGKFNSLQEAIDTLPASGGKLMIPPGRYEITQPVVVSCGDVMIQGAGTSTHIVNCNIENEPALRIQPPEGVKSLWRVQVCDLRITGNPKSGAGIHAKAIDEILLSRISVEHNGGDGIFLDHCYEDPRVCDCLITYNADTGLNLVGCHDIIVSANQFEENMDAIHCIDSFNLTMTGNNLDDHLGNGLVIRNTYGSVIAANMIEECEGTAVIVQGECYGDAFSANTFAHCKGGGVRIENARDITVSANTFVLLATHSIHALEGAAQITITGNTFCRYPFNPDKYRKKDPAGGILLETTSDVAISGNMFTAMYQEAIKAAGESNERIVITGNTVSNIAAEQPTPTAVFLLQNADTCIVKNNIIHIDAAENYTAVPAIVFEGACDTIISNDNLVSGYAPANNPSPVLE